MAVNGGSDSNNFINKQNQAIVQEHVSGFTNNNKHVKNFIYDANSASAFVLNKMILDNPI